MFGLHEGGSGVAWVFRVRLAKGLLCRLLLGGFEWLSELWAAKTAVTHLAQSAPSQPNPPEANPKSTRLQPTHTSPLPSPSLNPKQPKTHPEDGRVTARNPAQPAPSKSQRQLGEAFHGVTLPFGGAKGAAISLLMDLLSGLFTGAACWQRVSSRATAYCGWLRNPCRTTLKPRLKPEHLLVYARESFQGS